MTTVTTEQEAVARHLAQAVVNVIAGAPGPRRPGSDIVQVVRRQSA